MYCVFFLFLILMTINQSRPIHTKLATTSDSGMCHLLDGRIAAPISKFRNKYGPRNEKVVVSLCLQAGNAAVKESSMQNWKIKADPQ